MNPKPDHDNLPRARASARKSRQSERGVTVQGQDCSGPTPHNRDINMLKSPLAPSLTNLLRFQTLYPTYIHVYTTSTNPIYPHFLPESPLMYVCCHRGLCETVYDYRILWTLGVTRLACRMAHIYRKVAERHLRCEIRQLECSASLFQHSESDVCSRLVQLGRIAQTNAGALIIRVGFWGIF